MKVITKKEIAMLNDAIKRHKGEIIEPANDDKVIMNVIVNLYEKHLVKIDFEQDRLFVNELGRGLV